MARGAHERAEVDTKVLRRNRTRQSAAPGGPGASGTHRQTGMRTRTPVLRCQLRIESNERSSVSILQEPVGSNELRRLSGGKQGATSRESAAIRRYLR